VVQPPFVLTPPFAFGPAFVVGPRLRRLGVVVRGVERRGLIKGVVRLLVQAALQRGRAEPGARGADLTP